MRRILGCVLSLLILSLALCFGGTLAESNEQARTYLDTNMGIRVVMPQNWYDAARNTQTLMINTDGISAKVSYMPQSTRTALEEFYLNLPQQDEVSEEQIKQLTEQYTQILASGVPLLLIHLGEEEGAYAGSDEYITERTLKEIDGTKYRLYTNVGMDTSTLSDDDKAQVEGFLSTLPELEASIEVFGPNNVGQMMGNVLLDGETLAGESVTTSMVLGSRMTLVNVWATWCGPCVGEIPELQKLSEALPEGVKLVGVCTDGGLEPQLAKRILEQSDARYTNLIANDEMMSGFLSTVQAFPTTLFLDANGNIVGDMFVGAPPSDVVQTYLNEVEAHLKLIDTREASE